MIVKYPDNYEPKLFKFVSNAENMLKMQWLDDLKAFYENPSLLEGALECSAKVTLTLGAIIGLFVPILLPVTILEAGWAYGTYMAGYLVCAPIIAFGLMNMELPDIVNNIIGAPLYFVYLLSSIVLETVGRSLAVGISFVAVALYDLILSGMIAVGAALEIIGRIAIATICVTTGSVLLIASDMLGWLCDKVINLFTKTNVNNSSNLPIDETDESWENDICSFIKVMEDVGLNLIGLGCNISEEIALCPTVDDDEVEEEIVFVRLS